MVSYQKWMIWGTSISVNMEPPGAALPAMVAAHPATAAAHPAAVGHLGASHTMDG